MKRILFTLAISLLGVASVVSQTQMRATKSGVSKVVINAYFDSLKFNMPLGMPSYAAEDSLKRMGELMTTNDTLKFRGSSGSIERFSFKGGTSGQALIYDGRVWKPTTPVGTVFSVGLSMPSIFTVSNSPVTTSGTLTATLASQSQNLVFASPDGSAGVPTFRAVTSKDLSGILKTTGYSAENWTAVDSVLIWEVTRSITIDSITARQTGEGTVTINPKRIRSGSGVDLLSSDATITTTLGAVSGLQNGTLQNFDQIWFRTKSVTASTRQIFVQICWHYTP